MRLPTIFLKCSLCVLSIQQFWESVLAQDEQKIRTYFHPKAYVNWHCTNEHFSVEEFIQANCEYPGEWGGEVERVVETDGLTITVTHVYTTDYTLLFHVTSFIRLFIPILHCHGGKGN